MFLLEMLFVVSESRRARDALGSSGAPLRCAGLRIALLLHPPQTKPSTPTLSRHRGLHGVESIHSSTLSIPSAGQL